ncbi:hypothetical protein C7S20_17885 [Christiangramia fulva]|uniref:Uncharacterized protein n=1 Tax=Christiangramia fulva TaxID=2126553 RepID=A0A2R3Z9K7_9FLAO|nr:hypothetical protein [Christiangramia fulva]AVR46973.1 hypothetical protein C7S20_17885 [Christiangramia fulva]
MLEFFINSLFRGVLWEFLAALAAFIYFRRVKNIPLYKKIFIFYLCAMFLIDVLGYYVAVAYYSDYQIFGFTKGTVFERNYWLFNAVKPFAVLVYLQFFIFQIRSSKLRKILTWAAVVFFLSSLLYLIFSGEFFTAYAAFTPLAGSILLSITIACYLIEMLTSETILYFFKSLSFYVAVGALIWHLVFTPMFIYNKLNIMNSSPQFVKIYLMTLGILNFFMYSVFVLGFLVEMRSREKEGYVV